MRHAAARPPGVFEGTNSPPSRRSLRETGGFNSASAALPTGAGDAERVRVGGAKSASCPAVAGSPSAAAGTLGVAVGMVVAAAAGLRGDERRTAPRRSDIVRRWSGEMESAMVGAVHSRNAHDGTERTPCHQCRSLDIWTRPGRRRGIRRSGSADGDVLSSLPTIAGERTSSHATRPRAKLLRCWVEKSAADGSEGWRVRATCVPLTTSATAPAATVAGRGPAPR